MEIKGAIVPCSQFKRKIQMIIQYGINISNSTNDVGSHPYCLFHKICGTWGTNNPFLRKDHNLDPHHVLHFFFHGQRTVHSP
ncbi:hypothetical protein D3C76_1548840 [compost metagenome]